MTIFKQVLNILRKVTGNVSDVRGTAHRMWSTAASQPISATSLVNHTISSTVLQETHASCNQHSNIFKLVKPYLMLCRQKLALTCLRRSRQLRRSPFPVTLQRIFNTRLKNCRLLFSAVISEHFSKNRMIISVVAAEVRYLKKCAVFIGPPCKYCQVTFPQLS